MHKHVVHLPGAVVILDGAEPAEPEAEQVHLGDAHFIRGGCRLAEQEAGSCDFMSRLTRSLLFFWIKLGATYTS